MNYYEILEINEKASPEVIKMAYKVLILKYHPDRYQGDKNYAEEMTKKINEAFEVLSDEEKRKEYDMLIHNTNNINVNQQDNINKQENKTQSNYNSKSNCDNKKEKVTDNILVAISISCIPYQKEFLKDTNIKSKNIEMDLLILDILIFYLRMNTKKEREYLVEDFKKYILNFENGVYYYNKFVEELNHLYSEEVMYENAKKENMYKGLPPILKIILEVLYGRDRSIFDDYINSQTCMLIIEYLLKAEEIIKEVSNEKNYEKEEKSESFNIFDKILKCIPKQINIIEEYDSNINKSLINEKLIILNLILFFSYYIDKDNSIEDTNSCIKYYLTRNKFDEKLYKQYVTYLNRYLIYNSENEKKIDEGKKYEPSKLHIALEILYGKSEYYSYEQKLLCLNVIKVMDNELKG